MVGSKSCLICGSNSWEKFVQLPQVPIFPGCTESIETDRKPLSLAYCRHCALIKKDSKHTFSSSQNHDSNRERDIYYPLTKVIKKKIKEDLLFRNFITRNITVRGSVLDVGCHDGYFLSLFRKNGRQLFGCEPSFYARAAQENYGITVKQSLFSAKLYKQERFDLVTVRNILCLVDNPLSLLKDAVSLVKPSGYIALENIHINEFLKSELIPRFSHELIHYFSPHHILSLFSSANVKLVSVSFGRRMYFLAQKTSQINSNGQPISSSLYIQKVNEFKSDYQSNVIRKRKAFEKLARQWKKNKKRVALYGAGTNAQAIVSLFNLQRKDIDCVIDADPYKTGRYLRGTPFKICDPSAIENRKIDVIVVASCYQKEIIDFLRKLRVKSKIYIVEPNVMRVSA